MHLEVSKMPLSYQKVESNRLRSLENVSVVLSETNGIGDCTLKHININS